MKTPLGMSVFDSLNDPYDGTDPGEEAALEALRPAIELVSGEPVPADGSHLVLRPDGQQRDYVVLTEEERAKGFVRPYRSTYRHLTCDTTTQMGRAIAETYARDPKFYSGTYCVRCGGHRPLSEFVWEGTQETVGS